MITGLLSRHLKDGGILQGTPPLELFDVAEVDPARLWGIREAANEVGVLSHRLWQAVHVKCLIPIREFRGVQGVYLEDVQQWIDEHAAQSDLVFKGK